MRGRGWAVNKLPAHRTSYFLPVCPLTANSPGTLLATEIFAVKNLNRNKDEGGDEGEGLGCEQATGASHILFPSGLSSHSQQPRHFVSD